MLRRKDRRDAERLSCGVFRVTCLSWEGMNLPVCEAAVHMRRVSAQTRVHTSYCLSTLSFFLFFFAKRMKLSAVC